LSEAQDENKPHKLGRMKCTQGLASSAEWGSCNGQENNILSNETPKKDHKREVFDSEDQEISLEEIVDKG
jgi:hypothetical protein